VSVVVESVLAGVGDPGARLLDLGAGVAPWTRALCAKHPGLEAVAVDLPTSGDLSRVDLGEGFDTVLVSGGCRRFGEIQVRRLFERAAAATAPGGQILVIDALPADRRDGRSAGPVHGFADYAAWLFDAGFVRIEAEPLGPPEQVLIRARRPA